MGTAKVISAELRRARGGGDTGGLSICGGREEEERGWEGEGGREGGEGRRKESSE